MIALGPVISQDGSVIALGLGYHRAVPEISLAQRYLWVGPVIALARRYPRGRPRISLLRYILDGA